MKDYQIIEKIYESDNSLVYRAILKPDDKPIILKILKENYPTTSELTRYKQEYEITRSLNVDGIVKAYDLQRYENSLAMFLEDFGGQSLKLLISQGQLKVEEFLTIAIKITESLVAVHRANIIHKDINPSNIVYNPQTRQLKIIDFGISTRLSQEFQTVCSPHQLEGTLAYIAPEQTGRMNRGIDYRSDFYSLGVTFYELLTNKLPFETTDPMELVHCQIAQQPLPPHELIPDLPLAVSDIVIKLLAKTPEERYQSVWGIKADLKTCLNQLKSIGKISQFSLGSQDIPEKFNIPQKLYGREEEITQLLTAFEKVANPPESPLTKGGHRGVEMILISGYSGIGKSALVNEIHKPITGQRGQFISGKFDQLKRDIPYAAISQAFQDLINRLLGEPKITLQAWKEKILEALGNNGQIIIDVIPEIEKIIGQPPPVEPLGATESQNRFNLFFKRFLDVFCQKEHPLVIFIDDLQWADLPSLNLIEQLMSDPDIQYFLMIGAYRDNEVSPTHPLVHTLEKINQAKVLVDEITLSPLKFKHINQLIADTLNCEAEVSKPLAELVEKKTGGNPFFLTQLLYSLYQENLLVFNAHQCFVNSEDNQQGYWQWDIEQIESVSITDNVVELMVSKIEKLDQKTQQVLKLAACIGNHFNLEILSIVNNKSTIVTARELHSALDEGLIIPLDNNYKVPLLWNSEELSNNRSETSSDYSTYIPYKFLHDRVQQAAYSLIPENKKKQVHLQVGYFLLEKWTKYEFKEQIFNLVEHLNIGGKLITKRTQKDELAKLNFQAGKKAKNVAAYDLSLKFFEVALKLLTTNHWRTQYNFAYEIYLGTLELFFLNTKFKQAEELADILLDKAKNSLDKVKVYQIEILIYNAKSQENKAIMIAAKALAELGIVIELEESKIIQKIHQETKSLNLSLKKKSLKSLVSLPEMTDPYKIEAVIILQQIMSSTIIRNFLLHIEVVLIQINLCLKYGNSPLASCPYSFYGSFLCKGIQSINLNRDLDLGNKFGKLAIQLLEKFNNQQIYALTMHMYYGFIWHWENFIRNQIAHTRLLVGFQKAVETGSYEFACFASASFCFLRFFGGYFLDDMNIDFIKYLSVMNKFRQIHSVSCVNTFKKVTDHLIQNHTNSTFLVNGNSESEEKDYINNWKSNNWLLFFIYFSKTFINYIFKEKKEALINSIKTNQYVDYLSSHLCVPQYRFYASLSYCYAYHSCCDLSQQSHLLEFIKTHQEDFKQLIKSCPENFQHKYDLVEAEKARVLGKNWRAEEFYEKAIQGAKKYEFIHEEALAYERAAEFYLDLGREEIGQFYLRNAHHCYSRWGAKAKVKQLEEEYPQYLLGITNQSKSKSLNTTTSTTGSGGEILDLTTILKASQAISGEIKLEKLLQNLMKIVIENAGAEKGFLILNNEGNLLIEAQAKVDNDKVTILQSIPMESIEPKKSIPILPTTIINYVAHTQEYLVLNDAASEGQFINDPYIIATQSKSILCSPLLNQGKLSGIVYLENDLTTGAFTTERVELVNILSAQAAISIDNSRLYQTLEQRVEKRTKELSQTLDVLKATQAELIFENDLLKSGEQPSKFDYQVGGSLSMDAPTYVVRKADRTLYKALKQGQFCSILNPRQMGKSSLMVRMMNHLNHEGDKCAAIDLTRIGTRNVTVEQWYKGLAVDLLRTFGLRRKVNFKAWWNERLDISPVQRLSQFLEDVLLVEVNADNQESPQKIFIFIDEVDSVRGLNFPVDDFFALIRSCYNQRMTNPESRYEDLTFAFFGVATPSELITDSKKTPFNIGEAIELESFKIHEAQPLLYGLTEKVSNPQTILQEVLNWTGGQPFLTQKLCRLIHNAEETIPTNKETEWIENLVEEKIIKNWEEQDQPEHLRTIRDRILRSENRQQLLTLYQRILTERKIMMINSPEEQELRLSGLVIKQDGDLLVHNRIYESIFNLSWVEQSI